MIRVWVTRDEPRGGPLGAALREVGLEPVHEPVITRIRRSDARDELELLGEDDWLVLTSAFAVECLATDAINADRPPQVMAVGEMTAQAARDRGLFVHEVLDYGGTVELFDEVQRRMSRGIVCYPRSSLAVPPEPWGEVTVVAPVVYETLPRGFDRSILDRVDIVAVASPSAMRAIGRVDLPLASIGPTTTKAIRDLGMSPTVEASAPSFKVLARAVAALAEHMRPRSDG
jgi:uroporphyrinogen-III synthase